MARAWFVRLAAMVVVVGLGIGCAASRRQRPLPTTRITDSLQQVRKQLEGTWDLVTLEIHQPDGQAVQVGARGTLVYDAYGNLEIHGTITDAAYPKAAGSGALAATGQAVIDQANKQIKLVDVKGNVTDVAPEVSPDRIRRYEFDGDLLRLTSIDANGRATAVATWRKR